MKFEDAFKPSGEIVIGQSVDGLQPEDFVIEKIAGIDIYEPTIDNIEHFVKEYVTQQLYYLGKHFPINVTLIPSHMNDAKPEYVADATGIASFKYEGALIELPFVIYGGELVPFDVIQVGDQRVPFSTENMKKITRGIVEQNNNKQGAPGTKPFLGVDKPVNPSSSIGFLGSVLSIQNQHIGNGGDARHIYAEEQVFDEIEKEANIASTLIHDAGVVGLEGGLVGTAAGVMTEPKEGETQAQHVKKSAIKGAAIGAGLGAGISTGLGLARVAKSAEPNFDEMEKEAGKLGQFVDDVSGKTLQKAKNKLTDQEMKDMGFTPIAVGKDPFFQRFPHENKGDRVQAAKEVTNRARGAVAAGVGGAGVGIGAGIGIHNHQLSKENEKAAAELVFSTLEKIANLKPVNEDAILALFEKAAHEALVDDFEKLAAEDNSVDKEMAKVMKKVASIDWKNVASLKNGTYVMIPEVKSSNQLNITPEVSMTPAIVIDQFLDFGFENPGGKVVITADQRMKILKNGENMLCTVSDHPSFKLPTTTFSSVGAADIIIAFDGNKALYPSIINESSARNWACEPCYPDGDHQLRATRTSRKDDEVGKVFWLKPVGFNNQASAFISGNGMEFNYDDANHRELEFRITTLDNVKFAKMSYEEFLEAKAAETGIDMGILQGLLNKDSLNNTVNRYAPRSRKDNGVIATDPDTRVIVVKGVIQDYLKSAKDIDKMAENADTLAKQASSSEYVILRTKDKKANTFNLKIVYTDRSKRFFNHQVKNFENIEEYKARGILRACGFNQIDTAAIIQKAKIDNFSRMDLPEGATPDAVSGTAPKGIAADKFNNIKKVVFSPEVKHGLAVDIISTVLGDAGSEIGRIADSHKTASRSVNMFEKTSAEKYVPSRSELKMISNGLEKRARVAAATSSIFEKLAMTNKVKHFQDVAASCALACDFLEKTAEVLTSDGYYSLDSVAYEIEKGRSYFEKMAYDLTALKAMEYKDKNFLVNPSHIQHAVLSLDDMMKTAGAVLDAYGFDKEAGWGMAGKQWSGRINKVPKPAKPTVDNAKAVPNQVDGTAAKGLGKASESIFNAEKPGKSGNFAKEIADDKAKHEQKMNVLSHAGAAAAGAGLMGTAQAINNK